MAESKAGTQLTVRLAQNTRAMKEEDNEHERRLDKVCYELFGCDLWLVASTNS